MARNMTQGSITGHMLVYAVPLVFGNLFQQLYHTVDSVVVGQFNGKEALAAIGAAGPIMNILIFLIVGLSMGASIIMAEYFGAGDFPALKKEMATSIVAGKVSGANAADVSVWEESGDGRGRYEGELFLDGMKYEFELDPQTGRIFDWTADLRD